LVGFGIKDKVTFSAACAHANGAIIGTAFIKAIGESENIEETTASFLKSIID
jgi:tryptophan synthase alpha chain